MTKKAPHRIKVPVFNAECIFSQYLPMLVEDDASLSESDGISQCPDHVTAPILSLLSLSITYLGIFF